MQLTTRNATLGDLAQLLQQQHAAKLDVVAPAHTLRSRNGVLYVAGTDLDFSGDEPVPAAGAFVPTAVADEGLADKLGVPVTYLKRLRTERPDLYDANVNGWLLGGTWVEPHDEQIAEADPRSFLVRLFRGDPGAPGPGVCRAVLSDTYKRIDNLDVLMACLEGVKDAGVAVHMAGCDLTERRMYVRVVAPEVQAMAPALLRGYHSPYAHGGVARATTPEQEAANAAAGFGPGGEPILFAGFVISNSETGGGAFTITPRITARVCTNGMTVTRDALRNVHLGGKLDEGVVRWSDETQQRSLKLVASQARDAVTTFLDADYMAMVLDRVEEQAGKPLAQAADTIKVVGQQLRFTQERTDAILNHFILGGQATAGGVLNAVTSYAQTLGDADEAAEVEGLALRALELAAS